MPSTNVRATEARPTVHRPDVGESQDWLGRSFWTIVDQLAFSGSNLALNILLARWLLPMQYGAFSVAFSMFLLIGAMHSTILVEPMMVFGSGRYQPRFLDYLRALLRLHWRITLTIAAVGTVVAMLTWRRPWPFSSLLLAASIAMPAVLLSWLVRRAFYVVDRIEQGAVSSVVYATIVVAGVVGLRAGGGLSPATAFVTLAVAGLGSAMLSLRLIRVGTSREAIRTGEVLTTHLPYSRWAMASSLFMWIPTNAVIVAMPLVADLDASAGLKAALNVVAPAQTVWTALGLMLLPQLVRAGGLDDLALLRRSLLWTIGAGFAVWVALTFMSLPLMHLLYHGRYDHEAGLLIALAAFPLVCGIEIALEMLFRARQAPRQVFVAWVVASLVVIPAGIGATALFGSRAAAITIVATFAAAAALLARQAIVGRRAGQVESTVHVS